MSVAVAPTRSTSREILGLILHVPMAMIGGTCLAFVLAFAFDSLVTALGFHRLPEMGFYNPVFWLGSAFLGLIVNRITRQRSAIWVAAFGVCYLLWALHSYVPGLHTVDYDGYKVYYQGPTGWPSVVRSLHMLFSPTCKDGQCLEQFFVTVPLLNSISYSFGALFGLEFLHTENRRAQVSYPTPQPR